MTCGRSLPIRAHPLRGQSSSRPERLRGGGRTPVDSTDVLIVGGGVLGCARRQSPPVAATDATRDVSDWRRLAGFRAGGSPLELLRGGDVSIATCQCGGGWGFTLSPVLGRLAAELVVEGSASLDIEPFSLERAVARM